MEITVPEVACRGCARRAEAVLREHPGVTGAEVRHRQGRATVRFDQRTSPGELCRVLARAGYPAAPRARAPEALGARTATALGALALVVGLALASSLSGFGRSLGALATLPAALALALAVGTLGPRASGLARRGLLERDALWITAATASLALGVHELWRGEIAASPLGALGLSGPASGAPAGLVTAAVIAAVGIGGRALAIAIARRAGAPAVAAEGRARAAEADLRGAIARAMDSARWPVDDTWEDAAVRGIVAAALGCASFALVTRGLLGAEAQDGAAAAIATLVIASPAAIMVVAPLARALAMARAHALGVLVKDARALLALASVDTVCFEKNGTITAGPLRVERLTWGSLGADPALLADIAALERVAAHPLGRVIADHLEMQGIRGELGAGARVSESPSGIAGRARGALVEIGSPARFGVHAPATTAVVFAENGVVRGRFELGAALHPDARGVVRALRARRIRSALLSGDTPLATQRAAEALGTPFAGGLGPAEKAVAVRDLQLRGLSVALVTDGHHDPALAAQASVTVALAEDALPGAVRANLVVWDGGLGRLPDLVDLSRALRATLRASAAVGLVYNAALIPAAAMGLIPPVAAAALAILELGAGLALTARLSRWRPRRAAITSSS